MISQVLQFLYDQGHFVAIYTRIDGWIDYLSIRNGKYCVHDTEFSIKDVDRIVFASEFPVIYLKGA